MKAYMKEKQKPFLFAIASVAFMNLYFGFICATTVSFSDLVYLDIIYCLVAGIYAGNDYRIWKRLAGVCKQEQPVEEEEMRRLLGGQAYRLLSEGQGEKENEILQLKEELHELTDYITKWAHETKLPLASLKLMNERNQDEELKEEMKYCLERLSLFFNRMVMNGKLAYPQYDTKFEKTVLKDVVEMSMKNQSYFLIREHFQIKMELDDITVYSDKRWLVYLLDQLIGNSVKYRKEEPTLFFGAKNLADDEILFWIQDNGIGIKKQDIPYIFDKGYVGSNLRNGDYRSTGMGLYFAGKIAKHLGVQMKVQSKPEEGTRFEMYFKGNREYLILD